MRGEGSEAIHLDWVGLRGVRSAVNAGVHGRGPRGSLRLGAVDRQGLLCESQVGECRLEKCDGATGLYVAVSIGGWL